MYLSLYRKWRPRTFDDVVSQKHVTQTLKNEIKNERIAHAYLFTGPRGTGKTTCAKIFAKSINCLDIKDGEPCLNCDICKGCEADTVMDIVEMDGASNNSVNDIRTLIEEASFSPTVCRYRVYIIDEVHMLSQSAFNALLKIMEEPPSHVVFILATTEVNKIPLTIISRCQRFDFHRIQAEDITNRLLFIAKNENISLSTDAADLIARLCDGAMRDALSILDQASAVGGKIDESAVSNVVGLAKDEYIYNIHKAIKKNDSRRVLRLLNELYNSSFDIQVICGQLISFYRYVMICKTSNDELLHGSKSFIGYIKSAAQELDIFKIMYILNSLIAVSGSLKSSLNPRFELEICLVKLTVSEGAGQSNPPLTQQANKQINPGATASNSLSKNNTQEQTSASDNLKDIAPGSENHTPEGSETVGIKSFKDWDKVVLSLKENYNDAMSAGFLKDAKAYVNGDNEIKIKINNPIVKDNLAAKKDLLQEIIFKITKKNYIINFDVSSGPDNKSVLDKSLSAAKEMGIDVITE